MSRAPLVDVALTAARRGWHVFPICPGRKQPPRKAAADWEDAATTEAARILRWWATHPLDNVGIATGPSGLVVVDLDRPRPGVERLDASPPTSSFPSGHTSAAVALYIGMALLLAGLARHTWLKALCWALVLVLWVV